VPAVMQEAIAQTPSDETADIRPLTTNGFEVILPAMVEVITREIDDPTEVRSERERLRDHWFVHYHEGRLYHLRLRAGGPNVEGETVLISTQDHPWLLRSRLEDAVAEAMPQYEALRQRPFTFLAKRAELIHDAGEQANVSHPLLPEFLVTPSYTLSPKIYEPVDGTSKIGIFVTIGMRYEIKASL